MLGCVYSFLLACVQEALLLDAMFEVPGSGVSKVTFTKEAVAGEMKPEYTFSTKEESTSPSDISQNEGRKTANIAV